MRHVEGLRSALDDAGHDVRVFAPVDPPGLKSKLAHRGAEPQVRDIPEWLTPVGGTVGIPANGAVSNLMINPTGIATLRRELAAGAFDVVHVQEPIAPVVGWDSCSTPGAARVGTFHAFAENSFSNGVAKALGGSARLNHFHARIAVSEAAKWTASRFYGGRYSIIPNGTEVPTERPSKPASDGTLRLLFIGQAVGRKGLPVLLRAFEALREHAKVELTLVGVDAETLAPLINDSTGIKALGKVDDAHKLEQLRNADLLVAPSLRGESFGMVLTEAFAAGTPVVASDISGYRDVARNGLDSLLVAPGDAHALAHALRDLADDPARRRRMADAAWERAQRFAWRQVAEDVVGVYQQALAVRQPEGIVERLAVAVGSNPSDMLEKVPAQRVAPPDETPERRRERRRAMLRRGLLAFAGLGAAAASLWAVERIGPKRIASALLGSQPTLVLAALAVMCISMAFRAVAWDATLKAALPRSPLRMIDAMRATFIGVLMSATLPARLGEPARAMIISRRAGDPRETLPAVLGTIVSQTLVNLVAIVALGVVMFNSVPLFHGHSNTLVLVSIAPLLVALLVVVSPVLLARGANARSEKVSALAGKIRTAMLEMRLGLSVFRKPKPAAVTLTMQLGAWVLQCVSCWILLKAMGLEFKGGMAAAAAVLFAVNVTAALPAVPANIGVFQAACVAVLTGGFGVSASDALAYGIVLQAVELATAFVMGMPALVGEGVSWREVRLRAMHTTPVVLPERDRTEPQTKPTTAEFELLK